MTFQPFFFFYNLRYKCKHVAATEYQVQGEITSKAATAAAASYIFFSTIIYRGMLTLSPELLALAPARRIMRRRRWAHVFLFVFSAAYEYSLLFIKRKRKSRPAGNLKIATKNVLGNC